MKDSKNADIEIAVGVGAAAAALVETGVIASEGFVTGMVAQIGASTGLTAVAEIGAYGAGLLAGPVGWTAVAVGGLALAVHGFYRIT